MWGQENLGTKEYVDIARISLLLECEETNISVQESAI